MTTTSNDIWCKAQESEAKWWQAEGLGAINSYHEEFKQHIYAERMDILFDEWDRINLYGRSVLDIGGGPVSMLLKCFNSGKRKVIDPLDMPEWAILRYKSAGIDVEKIPAEEMNESGWDEVLIYNVLQHVQDPIKVIEKAKSAGKIIRVFEFLERPANEGHPHVLTADMLDKAFMQKGTVTEIKEPIRQSGVPAIVGKVYYGVFAGNGMSVTGMKPGIPLDEIEMHWVNTGTTFEYPYYLAVKTALKTQKAKKFNLWIVSEPTGKYYEDLKDKVTIRHISEAVPDFAVLKDKDAKFKAAHLVDYFRLKIMYENGGLYSDLDGISVTDYCQLALAELSKNGKEFIGELVGFPHLYGAGWFAARKNSPLIKLMMDMCYQRLNDIEGFKWGNSGPDIVNLVCLANQDKVVDTEYRMMGGDIELYELFKPDGVLTPNHRWIHVWANSINGYWTNITEEYIEINDHLYAKMIRNILSKEERHPHRSVTLNEWLAESRNRYRPLYDILKTRDCQNIMEIGVASGQNAILMVQTAAKRVPEEKINYFGFDIFDKITPELMESEYGSGPIPPREEVYKFITKYTKASIHLFEGLTKERLPKEVTNLPKMDIIFIDGGHSVDTIRGDWFHVKKLIKPSTVIVFDDYYPDVTFVGCKFLINELDKSKYSYEIMPELDNHTAPWGALKVQFLAVRPLLSASLAPLIPTMKPALHVLGLAHTKTTLEYNACAYTQKVFKMCKMMKKLGYEVYHYGAEGSNPDCTEHIDVVSDAVQFQTYGGYDWRKEAFRHDPNDLAYQTFDKNAIIEIKKRANPKDLLLISMGNYQKPISDQAGITAIEMGIGYTGVYTDRRIFESYAWMHYLYGLLYPNQGGCDGSNYDAVIPNYYDPKDFEFVEKKDNYYLYMGRLIGRKGAHIAAQCCERIGARLVMAGQGTEETVRLCGIDPKKVDFVGYADVKLRSTLMSHARAIFVPTQYLEPFGGVNVEAMFCGTPAITTDWGGFTETVEHGRTGYRCRTMDDYCWAAQNVDKLDHKYIHDYAVNNYSMDRVSLMYDEYFMKVMDLYKMGWYQLHPERTQLDWLTRYY
jgi:glycosyltransferase involved in cell wall biosynthesis